MNLQLISLVLTSTVVLSITWVPKRMAATCLTYHPLPSLTELHLTPQQQQALHVIHLNTKAQIREHLTPQQSQKFVSELLISRDFLTALVAIQLSDLQQTALTGVLHRSQELIQAVLDPQQQQSLDQLIHARIGTQLLSTLS